MNTANEVMEHAKNMELRSVDFLNANGVHAKSMANVTTVRYGFHDGKTFEISFAESSKLDSFEFKLRPTRDDA